MVTPHLRIALSTVKHARKLCDPKTNAPETRDPKTSDPETRDPKTSDPKEARVREARVQEARVREARVQEARTREAMFQESNVILDNIFTNTRKRTAATQRPATRRLTTRRLATRRPATRRRPESEKRESKRPESKKRESRTHEWPSWPPSYKAHSHMRTSEVRNEEEVQNYTQKMIKFSKSRTHSSQKMLLLRVDRKKRSLHIWAAWVWYPPHPPTSMLQAHAYQFIQNMNERFFSFCPEHSKTTNIEVGGGGESRKT